MIVQRALTVYPLASLGTVRSGTIGLIFGAAGAAVFTTKTGDVCTITALAGQEIETGPLDTVTTLPAGTLGVVGR